MLSRIAQACRIAIGVAAAVLVLFSFYWVLSRPFRRAEVTADQVQLTIVHWGDKNEDRIVARLVEDFEKQPENRNIRILRINPGQADKVNTKLRTMMAAGEPPDVFYLDFARVADFAEKGVLADIEEFIRRDKAAGVPTIELDRFYGAVVRAFRFNPETGLIGSGPLIAVPKDFTTVGFYYNKDLFRRAGVPEPSPAGWTWDEFIAAARAVGRLPNCYGADFVTWETMCRLWLWTHGLDFASPDWKTYRFTDPQVIAALDELRGWFHDEPRTLLSAKTQLETGQEPFLAGNIGLAGPFGRWKVPTYRLITGFDWDFAPLPMARGVGPRRNGVFTVGWAIPRDCKHPDESWRFVKYLMSSRGQELMCAEGLAVPVLRSVAEGPVFSDPTQKPEHYRNYLDAAEYADPIDFPADQEYQHTLRIQLENIFKMGAPVEPAMRQVEKDWLNLRRKQRDYPPMPWAKAIWGTAIPVAGLLVAAAGVWWVRRPRGLALGEEVAGSLMISPWLIGFAAFCLFPIVLSLLLAFCRWSGMAPLGSAEYAGWDNLRDYFDNQTFRKSLRLTAWYALLAVPSSQLAALGAALLMNHEWKSIGVFRAIWYLPSVLAGVGMAVMWKWVFHHEHGLIKTLLPTGWWSPAWFEKDAENWGVPAFAIINLWSVGGTMMIYLAGLKGIPKDLYEAASIDGATGLRKFFSVTLPMLSPVIFFNVIIAVIASFQIFTQSYVMTGGGPGDATRFYVVYLYNQAFDFHAMGYASGMAWMLLLIVLALTVLLMTTSRRFVHYEGLKA